MRIRDDKHLADIRQLPCIRCGNDVATEAAHYRRSDARIGKVNPGVGQKPHDKFVLPLCGEHHRLQHKIGEETFWRGCDPLLWSLAIYAAESHEEREKIVQAALRFQRGPLK